MKNKEDTIIDLLYKYSPIQSAIAQIRFLRKNVAEQQENFLKELQKIRDEKRWGEKGIQGEPGYTPVKGLDYFDGEDPVVPTDEIVEKVMALIPPPEKGDPGIDAIVDEKKIIKSVLAKIPPPIPGEAGKDAIINQDEIIEALIDRLKKKKELDISHIRNSDQFMYKGTKYKISELMHGAGSSTGGGSVTYSVDLSSQCDGLNKIFTVPTNTNYILLTGTDAPLIYKMTTDYTGSGTTVLTLTAAVNAPSSGATLILTYIV